MKRQLTIVVLPVALAAACSSFESDDKPVTNEVDGGSTASDGGGTESGTTDSGPLPCTTCKPRVLATGMDKAYGLAVDDEAVYVGSETGNLYRVVKATGERTTLVTGLSNARQPIVFAGEVYVGTDSGVVKISRAGDASVVSFVVSTPETAVIRDANHFFACRYDGGNAHDVVVISGAFATPIASGVVGCETIAFNDKYVFFGASTTLNRVPVDSVEVTSPTVLGKYHARRLVLDGDYVYSTAFLDGELRRIKIESTDQVPETVGKVNDGNTEYGDLAVDDRYVYWTLGRVFSPGKVVRVPKSGGEIVTLAQDLKIPMGIAVDAHAVYWAEHDTGILWMLEK